MRKLILLLVLILSFVSLTSAQFDSNNSITGYATTQQTSLSVLVVASLPSISITSPTNGTYINGSNIIVSFSAANYHKVWYKIDNGQNTTITSSSSISVSEGSHILYMYANNSDGAAVSTNVTFYVNSTKLLINYSNYYNSGNSTDFSTYSYESLQNMTNIVLENSYGKIKFNSAINITDDQNPDDRMIDIDNNIIISSNKIEINSTALPNFNKSATLKFYNVPFTNPIVLLDGSECPSLICTKESFISDTFTFNVTHFSSYSLIEGQSSSSSSTSSGGGGGSDIGEITVDKQTLSVKIRQGEVQSQQLTVKNNDYVTRHVEIKIENIEQLIRIIDNSFDLKPGESKTIDIDFIGGDSSIGLNLGKIIITAGSYKKEILAAIEINPKNSLFDVEIIIPEEYQKVFPGDEVISQVKLSNLGATERIDTELVYEIKDPRNKVILSKKRTLAVETRVETLETFKLPDDISPNVYLIEVTANYGEKTAASAAWFEVESASEWVSKDTITLVLITILVLLVINFIIKRLKRHKKF